MTTFARSSTALYWRLVSVVAVIAVYYGIQALTLALAISPRLDLTRVTDDVGLWVQRYDHHLWQMVLAIILIGLLGRGRWDRWGLNLHRWRTSLNGLRHGFFPQLLLALIAGEFLVPILTGTHAVSYPLSLVDFLGLFTFMALFSGLSEEILFRGLMQTWLAQFWRRGIAFMGVSISTAGLLTAVIFSLVHINFRLSPFEVTHFSVPQLILAFVMGVYYAVMYERTGSLLAPIIAHNAVNGGIFLARYSAATITG
jgi:uncharacterized protein